MPCSCWRTLKCWLQECSMWWTCVQRPGHGRRQAYSCCTELIAACCLHRQNNAAKPCDGAASTGTFTGATSVPLHLQVLSRQVYLPLIKAGRYVNCNISVVNARRIAIVGFQHCSKSPCRRLPLKHDESHAQARGSSKDRGRRPATDGAHRGRHPTPGELTGMVLP